MQRGGRKVYETAKQSNERGRERREARREERELLREERREEQELRRMDRKVAGVALDTRILPDKKQDPAYSRMRSVRLILTSF